MSGCVICSTSDRSNPIVCSLKDSTNGWALDGWQAMHRLTKAIINVDLSFRESKPVCRECNNNYDFTPRFLINANGDYVLDEVVVKV